MFLKNAHSTRDFLRRRKMGKSNGRDLYFEKAKSLATAHEVVKHFEASPYLSHRRYAKGMRRQLDELSAQAIKDLKAQAESQSFEKLIMS
jgi:hypothetical protein